MFQGKPEGFVFYISGTLEKMLKGNNIIVIYDVTVVISWPQRSLIC
jgi:hypothetical protein